MESSQNANNTPNSSANGKDEIVFTNKPKKSAGMITALVCAIILAIGGVGFGIWAIMDGNSKVAKKDEQINVLKELNNKQPINVEIDTEIDKEPASSISDTMNTAGYIYVGEWGLKIKVPESLSVTGYIYKMSAGYTSVGVLGTSKGGQYFPDFANIEKDSSSLGIVSRYSKETEPPLASRPDLIFSDEQYDYYYSHLQTVQSIDESEKAWEIESVELIQEMLSDKNNYSTI